MMGGCEVYGSVALAGVGNPYRHDDGIGCIVTALAADACAELYYLGSFLQPIDLLGRWNTTQEVVLVDAMCSGATPGSIIEVEIDTAEFISSIVHRSISRPPLSSSHGLGILEALSIARELDVLPARLLLIGIEGADFSEGVGLSEEVKKSIPQAVDLIVSLVRR